jgi:hypothetical protein
MKNDVKPTLSVCVVVVLLKTVEVQCSLQL